MNIILVVGPSGSGKDTLLRSAKRALAGHHNIAFVRRYITRPPDENEDNYYIDFACFDFLRQRGFFLSSWQAHSNYYGLAEHSFSVHNSLTTIVCSISRSAIADFDARFTRAHTIHVSVDMATLEERLRHRGRESEAAVQRRLARAESKVEAKKCIAFDNSDSLEQSCGRFISLLERLSQPRTYTAQRQSSHSI
ncbi:MAG: phosphonate metabolism protein/1,5-bisphosphokinase (PRPP-forming) PhnN [Desulfopila sp.]